MTPPAQRLAVGLAALACVAFAAGCGSSDDTSTTDGAASTAAATTTAAAAAAAPGTDAALRDKLPDDVKQANEISVATSLYPPVDFYEKDGKTLTGFDYEIVQEIGKRLGVKVTWHVIDFATVMPGIQSGQYDFATDLNDTAEREKVVDFVTEFRDGTSILVKKGNPDGVKDLTSLCGKSIVVTKGSTQVDLAAKQSKTCEGSGSGKLTVLQVPDDPEAMLTMRSGRADAYLVNTLAGSYSSKSQPNFEVLPGVYDTVFAGLVFPKDSTQLRDAVQAAMQALIDDGFYGKVLERYGISQNAIDSADVNAAASSS
jgi:polar amino acid transport system substrate-binding protein